MLDRVASAPLVLGAARGLIRRACMRAVRRRAAVVVRLGVVVRVVVSR
jgi:hypothetical protein